MLIYAALIYPKYTFSTDVVNWKWFIVFGYTVRYLLLGMVYKILGKFELYMFWIQGCRCLEWKIWNGIQIFKEGLLWSLARFTQCKVGWFCTWWMVWYNFSFILYWWYIVYYCEKHSPMSRSLDKSGNGKWFKDTGQVRPRKWSRVGWRIVECR